MSTSVDIAESGTPTDPSHDIQIGTGGPAESTGARTPLHWLVDGHWLGRFRTPSLLRIWRYGAGSIVAFVTSGVAFYICIDWFGLGAITCSVIAFFAGALPNWVLNRRWAWQKRGREGVGRDGPVRHGFIDQPGRVGRRHQADRAGGRGLQPLDEGRPGDAQLPQ